MRSSPAMEYRATRSAGASPWLAFGAPFFGYGFGYGGVRSPSPLVSSPDVLAGNHSADSSGTPTMSEVARALAPGAVLRAAVCPRRWRIPWRWWIRRCCDSTAAAEAWPLRLKSPKNTSSRAGGFGDGSSRLAGSRVTGIVSIVHNGELSWSCVLHPTLFADPTSPARRQPGSQTRGRRSTGSGRVPSQIRGSGIFTSSLYVNRYLVLISRIFIATWLCKARITSQ